MIRACISGWCYDFYLISMYLIFWSMPYKYVKNKVLASFKESGYFSFVSFNIITSFSGFSDEVHYVFTVFCQLFWPGPFLWYFSAIFLFFFLNKLLIFVYILFTFCDISHLPSYPFCALMNCRMKNLPLGCGRKRVIQKSWNPYMIDIMNCIKIW